MLVIYYIEIFQLLEQKNKKGYFYSLNKIIKFTQDIKIYNIF